MSGRARRWPSPGNGWHRRVVGSLICRPDAVLPVAPRLEFRPAPPISSSCCSTTTVGSATATSRPGPTRRASWPRTPSPCSTRRGRARRRRRHEPGRHGRAGAGDLLPRTREQARPRVHDAGRALVSPDAAADGRADARSAHAAARDRAAALRRERALARRSGRSGRADPGAPPAEPVRPARLAGSGGGGDDVRRARPDRRHSGIDARRHRHRGRRGRPSQLRAARRRHPGRAAGAGPGRPSVLLGGSFAVRDPREGVPPIERPACPRDAGSATARERRPSASRSTSTAGRSPTATSTTTPRRSRPTCSRRAWSTATAWRR